MATCHQFIIQACLRRAAHGGLWWSVVLRKHHLKCCRPLPESLLETKRVHFQSIFNSQTSHQLIFSESSSYCTSSHPPPYRGLTSAVPLAMQPQVICLIRHSLHLPVNPLKCLICQVFLGIMSPQLVNPIQWSHVPAFLSSAQALENIWRVLYQSEKGFQFLCVFVKGFLSPFYPS